MWQHVADPLGAACTSLLAGSCKSINLRVHAEQALHGIESACLA